MNREEKNQQTRRRIMDNALAEFSKRGYGAGSVNTICASKDISKGIIYHYFKTKDELYLACVEECFQRLTDHLRDALTVGQGTVKEQLEDVILHFNGMRQRHKSGISSAKPPVTLSL